MYDLLDKKNHLELAIHALKGRRRLGEVQKEKLKALRKDLSNVCIQISQEPLPFWDNYTFGRRHELFINFLTMPRC